MKRCMVFKLGRRFIRVWRRIFRHRRSKNYIRLGTYRSPTTPQNQITRSTTTTITRTLLNWSRCLTRSLRRRHDLDSKVPLLDAKCDAGDECKPPPKGYMAVSVAGDMDAGASPARRYLVPVFYFNHPLFGELLREAEEKHGFDHPGVITIPCGAAKFERIRSTIAAGVDGSAVDKYCRKSRGYEAHCSLQNRALFV